MPTLNIQFSLFAEKKVLEALNGRSPLLKPNNQIEEGLIPSRVHIKNLIWKFLEKTPRPHDKEMFDLIEKLDSTKNSVPTFKFLEEEINLIRNLLEKLGALYTNGSFQFDNFKEEKRRIEQEIDLFESRCFPDNFNLKNLLHHASNAFIRMAETERQIKIHLPLISVIDQNLILSFEIPSDSKEAFHLDQLELMFQKLGQEDFVVFPLKDPHNSNWKKVHEGENLPQSMTLAVERDVKISIQSMPHLEKPSTSIFQQQAEILKKKEAEAKDQRSTSPRTTSLRRSLSPSKALESLTNSFGKIFSPHTRRRQDPEKEEKPKSPTM